MKPIVLFSLSIISLIIFNQSANGQGAALQGVANTADALKQQVQSKQDPITAGPEDKRERTAPGKIDADAPREFSKTDSGLKYRVLRKSDGKKPVASDTVVAHYKGWLDNKTIFDSSYRRGKPIPFPLRGVIGGWTEGVPLIGKGGMIELEIPYQLGYGERGMPAAGIPPKATLHFIVELVDIK